MPPKEKPSKKAVQAKQAKVIEDSTFGLKNKNKSKKVQQFIDRVERTVKHSQGDDAKAKEAKKEAKLAKQLQEEELRILFNEGIANQYGKKKSKAQSMAEQMGIAEANKEVERLLEEMSSDSDSDESTGNDRGIVDVAWEEEPVAVEVFREKTIEDIIEEQRAKLAAEGKVGTPVTAESFARWRAGKLAQRQAEAEARMKMEQTKRKGGKGLSVLSGKELFNYNSSLFVDDEAAIDAAEENELNAENRKAEQEEELRAAAEAERAQAEQLRLAEAQRLEDEDNARKDEERRQIARDPNRITFMLGSVVINQIVFDVNEKEDLELFPELMTDREEESGAEEDPEVSEEPEN